MVKRGFSLVEVIVALTLLSVGMLAVAGSSVMTARLLNQAELHEEMATRAASVLDSLIINRVYGAGTIAAPASRIEWSAGAHVVEVRATITAMALSPPPLVLRSAR